MKKTLIFILILCVFSTRMFAQLQTLTINNNNYCDAQIVVSAHDIINYPPCQALMTNSFWLCAGSSVTFISVVDLYCPGLIDCYSLTYSWLGCPTPAIASSMWDGVQVWFGTNNVLVSPSGSCTGAPALGSVVDCAGVSQFVKWGVNSLGNYIVDIF